MSHQIWIVCPKSNAQELKSLLGEKLCRTQKIKKSIIPDYILVPTTEYRDEYQYRENTAAFTNKFLYQILGPSPLHSSISLVFIPKVQKATSQSPIEVAVSKWLLSLPKELLEQEHSLSKEKLLQQVPKRWSAYHPMVLLPTGSFQDEQWKYLLDRLTVQSREELLRLWEAILGAIEEVEGKGQEGERRLTHLAVNAAIPLQHGSKNPLDDTGIESEGVNTHSDDSNQNNGSVAPDQQNFLRSPSGLIMLYGDFGPTIHQPDDGSEYTPSAKDFEEAFWVSTYQNGIYQTWAPRYTMFSRGNIKEKVRILNFHNPSSPTSSSSMSSSNNKNNNKLNSLSPEACERRTAITKEQLRESIAVDMYAGIGYFVFSYIKMGIGKVICFEINPWSVEGLRRGASKNGWSTKVLTSKELDDISAGRKKTNDIPLGNDERILVFQESNTNAIERISQLENIYDPSPGPDEGEKTSDTNSYPSSKPCAETQDRGLEKNKNKNKNKSILHINLGLLPTSKDSWSPSLHLLINQPPQQQSSGSSSSGLVLGRGRGCRYGWLHIHENIAIGDIDSKKREIERFLRSKMVVKVGVEVVVEVEWVEFVKTFAPGVWHCVFDVWVCAFVGGGFGFGDREEGVRGRS